MPTALVRRPSPRVAEGLVTYIARRPVDASLAAAQWAGYVAAFEQAGWKTIEVDPADECPDGVFIEDTLVVCRGVAVIARPAAESRAQEVEAVAATVCRSAIRRNGSSSRGRSTAATSSRLATRCTSAPAAHECRGR